MPALQMVLHQLRGFSCAGTSWGEESGAMSAQHSMLARKWTTAKRLLLICCSGWTVSFTHMQAPKMLLVFWEIQSETEVSLWLGPFGEEKFDNPEYALLRTPPKTHTQRLDVCKPLNSTFKCSNHYFQNAHFLWDHANNSEKKIIMQEMGRWILKPHG